MRTLKFRVWDHDEERFIEWFNPDPMLSCKDGELWCYERRGKDENGNWIPGDDLIHISTSKRNLTLQQFTGLLDKNGKEIYEGDIIVGKFDMGPAGWVDHKWTVQWHNELGYQWDYWKLDTIEVIGNIFESNLDVPQETF